MLNWNDQLNLFESTVAKHGRIDVVLANAGVHEKLEDVFADIFDSNGRLQEPSLVVLDINLRGAVFTTKLALHYFRKQPGLGSIVLTGSLASYLPTTGIPMYNTSKHGLLGLMRSLRGTLASQDQERIRINLVAPAFTRTPFTEKSLEMWQRENLPINKPEDVARAIVYVAVNDKFNGKGVYIAGGKSTELEDSIEQS